MKQGQQTPALITEFIVAQYLADPTLSGRQIAKQVEQAFGRETSIDKTTVTRIIQRAGLGGQRADRRRLRLLEIPEQWPHGTLSGSKEIRRGAAATRWATDRPQQVGDDFGLDLGQAVTIKSVQFLQGSQHAWDHPKRWRMVFSDQWGTIVKEVEGGGEGHQTFVQVSLEEPVSVRYIGVIILEPRLPSDHPPATCWAVDNIVME